MRYIYLSAFRPVCGYTCTHQTNMMAHKELLALLDTAGYIHQVVQGSYKGVRELAVQVQLLYRQSLVPILALARDLVQESVLYVEDEEAWLVYPAATDDIDCRHVPLGTWQLTDRRTALHGGNYTKIGEDYYTCAPAALERVTGWWAA